MRQKSDERATADWKKDFRGFLQRLKTIEVLDKQTWNMLENVMLSFIVDGTVRILYPLLTIFLFIHIVLIWQHVLLHNNVVTSNKVLTII